MQTVTSFPASAVSRDELSDILSDYIALDHARIIRRLLVTRFGLLALCAATVGGFVHGLSSYARWIPLGLFLTPPAWAWVSELRLRHRLSRRLQRVDEPATDRA